MTRRLLAGLLLLLCAVPVFAAAKTANTDGLWSATATWSGAAVPGLGDTCTINAGIEVICDTSPCQCGGLTINGGLGYLTESSSYGVKLGNATNLTNDGDMNINGGGSFIGGPGNTLEFNLDRSGTAKDLGVVTVASGGSMTFAGRKITEGVITSLAAVTGNAPDRTITLTDMSLAGFPYNNQFNGKFLRATSGYFKGHVFEVTTGGATPQEIVIKMDTRGALDSRHALGRVDVTTWAPGDWGKIYSTGNATVANGGTAITFASAQGSGVTEATARLLGSRFVCDADIGLGGVFTDFRRICAVGSTTTATLCTTYGTASCAAGAAFRVYNDNAPPQFVVIQDRFQPGDTYEIEYPFQATITAAQRSDVTPTNQFNIVAADGSAVRITDSLIDYCGKDDGIAFDESCIKVTGIDNDNDSEQFIFKDSSLWHFSGENGIRLNDCDHIHIDGAAITDAAEGGLEDGHEAHGIYIEDISGGHARGMQVSNSRMMRMNDAGIVMSTSVSTGIACTDCEFWNNSFGFAPGNGGGSVSGITATNSLVRTRIHDNFFTNIQDAGVLLNTNDTSPDSLDTPIVDRNLVMNIKGGSAISFGIYTAADAPDTLMKGVAVNNAVIGMRRGILRGRLWSNYLANLYGAGGSTDGPVVGMAGVVGNVILGGVNVASNAGDAITHEPSSAAIAALSPNTIAIQDNSIVASATKVSAAATFPIRPRAASNGQPNTYFINHNSVDCRQSAATGGGVVYAVADSPALNKIINVTNNVFMDCQAGINEVTTGGGSADTTSSYNLYWKCVNDTGSVTQGTSELSTNSGVSYNISPARLEDGDLAMAPGSAPWNNLGSDGYVRGVRVAGPPNPDIFRRLYPFPILVDLTGKVVYSAGDLRVLPIVNSNAIGDRDTDGDGVWDLHDNCDNTFNPNQYDGDGDGIGCACDASGDTCP